MADMKYVYGPVPSRRLGLSLGISPIPKKTCNYSCIYCQLGRTDHMTNTRQLFYPIEEMIAELEAFLQSGTAFDVVTIVGEGEPTLYLGLGELIEEIQARTEKPVAVITNGALLYDPAVRRELGRADLVLPTMGAYDEASFKTISRPHGSLHFAEVFSGLQAFSKEYKGQLWIEIMLVAGVNDDEATLARYAAMLRTLDYDRLYLNTPVRPPAEDYARAVDEEKMQAAVAVLGGISISLLESQGFHSEIADPYEAIMSIIKRHPMNQFEIEGFLASRDCADDASILTRLKGDAKVSVIYYKGYDTFRLK